MKKNWALIIVLQFLMNTASFAQIPYVRITNGLDEPVFEKGRTVFVFNDINDDGLVDILSIGDHGSPLFNSPQHGIMVWFNRGNNSFENYMNGHFGYGGIAVGDVNNDGLKDVGYGMHHNYSNTGFGDQLIEVALGDGTGMNWIPWDDGLATNGESWGMFGTDLADVNNNGLLDLVSISFGGGDGLHVYLNQGDGSWQQSFGFICGNSDNLVYFCDINNDGFMDIVASHSSGTAYFGDGTGNFQKNDTGLPEIGQNAVRKGIAVGDINNDGGCGLAYANSNGGIAVFDWDNESGSWVDFSGNLPATGNYSLVQLWDMNADGFMDVMAFGNRNFKLWLGDGNGNWTEDAILQTLQAPGTAKSFAAGGDLNKTGIGDILILAEEPGFPIQRSVLYVYVDDTEPDSLWIRSLYPKGKECLYAGSIRFIQWASAVPQAADSKVKIEISVYGPDGPWWPVADSIPDNGTYQWTVPNYGSTNCYLKLTISSGSLVASHILNEAFTIYGEPVALKTQLTTIQAYIFPNPAEHQINIVSQEIDFQFILRNNVGKKILELINQNNINLSNVAAGIYFYEIRGIKGGQVFGKVIKL